MTTEPAYLTLQSGTNRYLTKAAGTNYYLTLQDPAPYDNDVSLLLAEAAWYIDSHDSNYSGGQSVPNMGTAGTALNAQMGSGTAVDTNDPKWLAYDPADGAYAYLPGVAGNSLSLPYSAALETNGSAFTIAARAAIDYSAGEQSIYSRRQNGADAGPSLYVVNDRFRLYYGTLAGSWNSVDGSVVAGLTDGSPKWYKAEVSAATPPVATFYYAADSETEPVSWTSAGTATMDASTVLANTSTAPYIGIRAGNVSEPLSGKVYRVVHRIDGTTVLDVDTSVLTSGSQTTFTEQSSNAATVTVNRSTSGRKTTLVGGWAGGGSLWLLGTDDYLEVIDDPAIDFGASDSFTVLAVVRQWDVAALQALVFKMFTFGGTGWAVYGNSSLGVARIDDGSVDIVAATATRTAGNADTLVAVRDVTADTITSYLNAAPGTPTTDTVTATLANSEPLRVGSISGGGFNADMEFQAAAIWRRALTAGEIAGLNRYFQNRAYNG